jgi:hypothetical protein
VLFLFEEVHFFLQQLDFLLETGQFKSERIELASEFGQLFGLEFDLSFKERLVMLQVIYLGL